MQKLQKGDVVHVRAVVEQALDRDGDVYLNVRGMCCTRDVWCLPSEIVHHEPRKLQVGDKVHTPGYRNSTIVAIHGDEIWVDRGTPYGCARYPWRALERAE